jgi:hypothetical protein
MYMMSEPMTRFFDDIWNNIDDTCHGEVDECIAMREGGGRGTEQQSSTTMATPGRPASI